MKAVVQERYGSSEELEVREVERPHVGSDQVLVRVRAASLHPDVWHVVCGRPWVLRLMGGGVVRPRNPIPGTDMAGVVVEVGDDVTRLQAGDEVFGETITRHQWTHGGAFAEYVAVREEWLAEKPGNVSFEEAAAVPTAGFIALINLRDPDRMGPGRTVLVNGAGGGVGSVALQVAKAQGARVTAVDSPRKLEMLEALGADEVVDYTREDFTRRGERYDLIVDIPGNHAFSQCRRALKPDGRYILIGHEGFGRTSRRRVFGLLPEMAGLMIRSRFVEQLRGPGIPQPTRHRCMIVLRDMLSAGTLTPVIDSTFPLQAVRQAFRHMAEDELLGRVILQVPA